MKRSEHLRDLRLLIPVYGSDNIIYQDESGFEEDVRRVQAGQSAAQKSTLMCAAGGIHAQI